ncbi:MAG: glucose-6-phosphate dehydrogenase, partial [Planctomycetes bacterium]|nr:glucose-6-phosphate dehydrogenase [Planctomycetota bacterium]
RFSVREEARGQADNRRRTLAGLRGRVVEVGAGNGLNFEHYPDTVTEVLVELKRPPIAKFFPNQGNYVRFRLSPDVAIGIGARIKHPGDGWHGDTVELSAVKQQNSDEMDPYERLLGDAMDGEGILFTREDAVEAAWQIVQPVLRPPGHGARLPEYEQGSWGPSEADELVKGYGDWNDPKAEG